MARTTRLLAVTTVIGVVSSAWLYFDNRSLRSELAQGKGPPLATKVGDEAPAAKPDPWMQPQARSADLRARTTPAAQPALPEEHDESRLDRRARRTEEFGAMFGRHAGETEDEYRARIGPMISAGLLIPRAKAAEYRRIAEEKAHVTPEQSARLDKAFDKVYGDVLDYTNKAIGDGSLSPYERNVAGWLEIAGGLGTMLGNTNQAIGKILDPDQVKTMSAAGFEWGEYLGAMAPWENLDAPPPRKPPP